MRLGPIDFHDKLITAHREGNLVVFVGSGASRGTPANLPTFEDLARTIAGGAYDKNVDGPEDQFLGRKAKDGVKVHMRAREIIGDRSSNPNRLHELLVELSSCGGPLRIVTTNFDRHLSTAASKICIRSPDIFYAPALPLGSEFTGIVYLHGSVERDERSITLTDEDFGRAYLTDGWATRFLVGLFQSYTVLFVGYSHNDVIVSYLARGLPPQAKPRFALTDQNDPRWPFLGVTPIVYSPDNGHAALSKGLEEWVELSKMGTLDHEQRIRKIVSAPPPLDQQEADYIRGVLQDPAKLQFFARYASSEDWLEWVEQQEAFKWLFRPELGPQVDPERPITQVAAQLAGWFARAFVLSLPDRSMLTIQRQGRQIQAMLWNEIASHLFSGKPSPSPEVLAKWIGILIPPPHGHFRTLLWGLLDRCQPLEDDATPLAMFDHLTIPRLVLKKRLVRLEAEPEIDWDVVIGGWDFISKSTNAATSHELSESWKKVFQPNLGLFAHRLVPLLTSRLCQAHLLFRSVDKVYEGWDPFSIRYQNIEHGDQAYWDFVPLVDAARDVLLWLLTNDRVRAERVIDEWISSEVPLLKRLAIYGLIKHDGWNADEKLTRILNAAVIYAVTPEPEVNQILISEYPKASSPIRDLVIRQLMNPPMRLDEAERYYLSYAMLSRLLRVAPDCNLLHERISDILAKHPEFKSQQAPRAEDELLDAAGSVVGLAQPAAVQKLLALDPKKDLAEILEYVGEQ